MESPTPLLKRLTVPVTDTHTVIGRGIEFEANPSICHFTGFVVGRQFVQEITIINISSSSKRLEILPLNSPAYKLEYELFGTIAPGLCQKIRVIFSPQEYKYYYDCIRIRGKAQELLIPLHAYPVLNKINFPSELSFGVSPLCEPSSKVQEKYVLYILAYLLLNLNYNF